jgi:hypothetical protein
MENDPKFEKAQKYLKEIKFEEDLVDAMIQTHHMQTPQVSAAAWTELFTGLDYGRMINAHARRLANKFSEEELDDLLNFAKSPVFQKLIRTRLSDNFETDEVGDRWFVEMEEEFLSRAKYVFTKHKADMRIYDLLAASIQILKEK